jgi:DNA-directed RNA polymerase specialized sigma24 family protein
MISSNAAAFPSSHWSLIARAGAADSVEARAALADLCRRYWYPLYAFIRRQLDSTHDAEDVTQGFFAHLLANDLIADADRTRGRFRTYLLACCKYYLANFRRAARSTKRGGDVSILCLDFESAEGRFAREPVDSKADALYMRRWAFTLLDESFAALEKEYGDDKRTKLFILQGRG